MGTTPTQGDTDSVESTSDHGDSRRIPPSNRVARIAGVASLLGVVVVIATLVMQITMPAPAATTKAGKLTHLATYENTVRLGNGLYPLFHLTLIVLFVSLYQLLREAGGLARFALATSLVGLVFFLLTIFLYDARIELATQFVAAEQPAQQSLLGTAAVVERLQLVVSLAGHVITWGLGLAAFSVLLLRQSMLTRWHAGLGLLIAVLAWLNLARLSESAFGPLLLVLNVALLVWLVATGISLLRIDLESERTHGS